MPAQKQYLDYLIDPNFKGTRRSFVLLFEDNTVRTGHTEYFILKIETKNCNVITDGQKFFDQSIKNDIRIYGTIGKIAKVQGNDYITCSLLDYTSKKITYDILSIL